MTMSTSEQRTGSLTHEVAAEIRAWMGRQGVRQAQLARRLGENEQWLSTRLRGVTPINLNDLQRIADALGLQPVDFFPSAMVRPNNRSSDPAVRPTPQRRRVTSRPNGRPRAETTRPMSAPPATKRRPMPVGRPMSAR